MIHSNVNVGKENYQTLAIWLGLALLATWGAAPAYAINLYWDANGASAGTGGTGFWNTSDNTWRNGSAVGSPQAWANV